MLNMIKRSLSGGESPPTKTPVKKPRIDGSSDSEPETEVIQEQSKSESNEQDLSAMGIPEDTPEWGKHLLRVMKQDFRTLSQQIGNLETKNENAETAVKGIGERLAKIEIDNATLKEENMKLKEKLVDQEYRQRRNNLLFEGITETDNETDSNCFEKLTAVLNAITPVNEWKYERCHRLGPRPKKKTKRQFNRQVICCFSSYQDVNQILRNRKKLPKGVYVSEDLPEEWVDKRRVLKPIFNTARRTEGLKDKTFLSRDKLIFNGKAYGADVNCSPNYTQLSSVIDIPNTCQRSEGNCVVFQGMHSYFSNLFLVNFIVDSVKYICVEQYFQSAKANLFGDTQTAERIMAEDNPYRMKKLGSRVHNFDFDKWKTECKSVLYKGLKEKFIQNSDLKGILLATGISKIGEATMDEYWGIGMRLHDKNALDDTKWLRDGVMCELLTKLRHELRA